MKEIMGGISIFKHIVLVLVLPPPYQIGLTQNYRPKMSLNGPTWKRHVNHSRLLPNCTVKTTHTSTIQSTIIRCRLFKALKVEKQQYVQQNRWDRAII